MEINKCQNSNFNIFSILLINGIIILFSLITNFYNFITNDFITDEFINFKKTQKFLYEIIIINVLMFMYFVLFGYSITLFVC
jgi:hypothetical protein